jgi:hypothetical protein
VGLTSPHCIKNNIDMNVLTEPRTWTDSLIERPKRWNVDMRLERGMLEDCMGQVN